MIVPLNVATDGFLASSRLAIASRGYLGTIIRRSKIGSARPTVDIYSDLEDEIRTSRDSEELPKEKGKVDTTMDPKFDQNVSGHGEYMPGKVAKMDKKLAKIKNEKNNFDVVPSKTRGEKNKAMLNCEHPRGNR